ncbi:type I-E CRISPR-associated protein Cse2/CasB [Lactobacillus sp. ESL0236]|uniref:type I-E CRISPR-associated protein Cse2/CasB n=1 Tax=unclassified Lactobacillus TaxID=2620435 RepID=UPI000EFDA04D|nr:MULTISPECIES: type I-E CRISPR-associated protein Cse2/CasB [unclassified Lactobacillus]RMC41964.1 type I-E CRISPR-associated protein Cse2/CasB [Lactobacillus sp. ESL0237]RMC45571.1 type I-E CRISPR-associated protein Cse2/CasB [Lactobacillus sp. ESL0234]RMC46957.1 type I-E CRISPR-associated protein Cse2/CasB [Lactobacillus sp. ESL0236]
MADDYKIKAVTNKIIERLYNNGDLDKATLAALRGASKLTSPKAQKAWPIIMDYLPHKYLSQNGKPTAGEVAVYADIRFYAIFQQGQDKFVSVKEENSSAGVSFFTALAKLRQDEKVKQALDRRVQVLLATTNIDSVLNSLVHLVEILKSNDNKTLEIDFPMLAQDLYKFQWNYHCANEVRLAWGEEYFGHNNDLSEGK